MTQQDVNRYAQVAAMIRDLEAEKTNLRDMAISHLGDGLECPSDGPFVLTLSWEERPPSWKDVCLGLLDTLSERARSAAGKFIANRLADRKPVAVVKAVANSKWQQKAA